MNIISRIEYQHLRQFEEQIGGNVKVGGYKMDKLCPIEEGYCVIFGQSDHPVPI